MPGPLHTPGHKLPDQKPASEEEMLADHEFAIKLFGTPEQLKERLRQVREAGYSVPTTTLVKPDE